MKLLVPFFEFLLGANWRTTLSGSGSKIMFFLGLMAAVPYEKQTPGSLSAQIFAIVPVAYQGVFITACGVAALILGIWNASMQKDKAVAGNGTPFNPISVNDGRSYTGPTIAPLIALLLIPAFLLTGCLSTDTGNLSHDRRNAVANVLLNKAAKVLGQLAVNTLANAASQEMSGGKVDWQSTAAKAAWEQAPSIVTSDDLEAVLAAATLNHTPVTVAAAGLQLQAAQEAGVPTVAAVNAIANTISGTALAKGPVRTP